MTDIDPNAADDTAPANPTEFAAAWVKAIDASSEEEKEWRETDAKKAVDAYRGGYDSPMSDFNIYHSNIETVVPTLYNSRPVPDARRRYLDDDPVAKEATDIIERSLSYSIDTQDFDQTVVQSVRDMTTVGRGIVRVRYDADIDENTDTVAHEEIKFEYVPWKHFRRGQGRVWDDVTWIAFEHFLSKKDLEHVADPEVDLDEVSYEFSVIGEEDKGAPTAQRSGPTRRARVWEIWDAETRSVIFIAPCYKEGPLTIRDDPLQLQGFFPLPRPMQVLGETGSLVPITSYRVHEALYDDAQRLSRRIRNLTKQARARGGYAGDLDVQRIADADDGELVPLANIDLLLQTQGKGLDALIVWFPLEKTIQAIQVLSERLAALKQEIYEVTGLSDIIRGASDPKETATAQNIKNQWGSVRIQAMQSEVQRFIRDLFRISAELVCEQFSEETLARMTGIQPQAETIALMRDETARGFRVDIESDSTIQGDLMRGQQQMQGFMQGTSQYLSAVAPAVMQGVLPPEIAVEIFSAFARQFRLGKQAEDALEQLADGIKSGEKTVDPQAGERQKFEADQQERQMRLQFEERRLSMEEGKMEHDKSVDAEKIEIEWAKLDQAGEHAVEKSAIERGRMMQDRLKHSEALAAGERQSRDKIASGERSQQAQLDAKRESEERAAINQGM